MPNKWSQVSEPIRKQVGRIRSIGATKLSDRESRKLTEAYEALAELILPLERDAALQRRTSAMATVRREGGNLVVTYWRDRISPQPDNEGLYQELKELAERAGLSKAINHPSCQMWEGLDTELAEFAALIAQQCATIARETGGTGSRCAAENLRNQADRWRSVIPSKPEENL